MNFFSVLGDAKSTKQVITTIIKPASGWSPVSAFEATQCGKHGAVVVGWDMWDQLGLYSKLDPHKCVVIADNSMWSEDVWWHSTLDSMKKDKGLTGQYILFT